MGIFSLLDRALDCFELMDKRDFSFLVLILVALRSVDMFFREGVERRGGIGAIVNVRLRGNVFEKAAVVK